MFTTRYRGYYYDEETGYWLKWSTILKAAASVVVAVAVLQAKNQQQNLKVLAVEVVAPAEEIVAATMQMLEAEKRAVDRGYRLK